MQAIGRNKSGIRVLVWILCMIIIISIFHVSQFLYADEAIKSGRGHTMTLQVENRQITEGYDRSLAVTCDNGTFVGQATNGVLSYKGIPYAEPPVGGLRWKAPVDAAPNDGVYEALYFGKSGIQAGAKSASLNRQGEDCLTLNVWTSGAQSSGDAAPKAVMVFFPGGAYGTGGTADPLYNGQNLVEAHGDVVLVTVSCRSGLMGFADFTGIEGAEDYAESGNLGLLDQVSALRWIQRNIAGFGGNPDNVTVFGESAGASSVSFLPLIEDAKGLFHRVIAQSDSLAFSFSREERQAQTAALIREARVSSMKELLALSEQELMEIADRLSDYNNYPERDGVVIPEDVYAAYAAGTASNVDMMTGTNADEARYWIGEAGSYPIYRLAGRMMYNSTLQRIEKSDRRYADAFLALQNGEDVWNMTEFINELLFREPAIRQAELHAESGGRHYMYYWTKQSDIEQYGACHAVELAYVFNNLDDSVYTGEQADAQLAATVQEMWVNFAKNGDPSTEAYKWEEYGKDTRQTMVLGEDIHLVSDPMSQQRILIEPLLKYRFTRQG